MSQYARTQIISHLEANSDEDFIDLTAAHQELKELLADNNLQPDAPFVGLEFLGGDIIPVSLAATDKTGLYREIGSLEIHICQQAAMGAGQKILTRGEALQKLFFGRRLGDVVIDEVRQISTAEGSTLNFDGGYVSGTFQVGFYRDIPEITNY